MSSGLNSLSMLLSSFGVKNRADGQLIGWMDDRFDPIAAVVTHGAMLDMREILSLLHSLGGSS